MGISSAELKAAGFGKPQRPAEGLIPLQSVQDNARRDVRERGGGPQGLFNPHTGLPLVDTSQPGPGAAYARNLTRAFFTQADFGDIGAFGARPSPEARARLLRFLATLDGATAAQTERGGGRGPEVGPGSPVGPSSTGAGPRVTTGISELHGDVLSGITAGFGLSGVGFVPAIVNRYFGNVPGVVGGDPAPKVGTPGFAKEVAMGRLARSLGRPTAGTGVRGGKALGAQGMRGL